MSSSIMGILISRRFGLLKTIVGFCLLCFLTNCGGVSTTTGTGSSGSSGGASGGDDEETKDSPQAGPPSTPAEIPSNLGSLVEKAGSALVNDFRSSQFTSSDLSSLPTISYGTESQFNSFVTFSNGALLTEIFGSKKEAPKVDTKIRIVLAKAATQINDLLTSDPSFTCRPGTALKSADTVAISFYGKIPNGPASNRSFDCVVAFAAESKVYGKGEDGAIRVVSMEKKPLKNTTDVATRGDKSILHSVIYTTIHQTTSGSSTVVFLDIQYAFANIYNGADLDFSTTGDNVIFKGRTRITGRSVLDANENISSGKGEFRMSRVDRGTRDSERNITQTIGRGGYQIGEASLFRIYADYSQTLKNNSGTFCIKAADTAGGIPTTTNTSGCSSYEAGFAWGGETIPYTLDPALQSNFEDILFFKDDSTDMIADDASNFSIPTY